MTGAIYNINTGKIYSILSCLPEHVEGSIPQGHLFWENCPHGATHIIDGVPVAISPSPPVLTPEQRKQRLVSAVQGHLDTTVKARGYDNIMSLCTYVASSDPVFRAEGAAGVAWRDTVWRYCWDVLGDVLAGVRSEPTPSELISELPVFSWGS